MGLSRGEQQALNGAVTALAGMIQDLHVRALRLEALAFPEEVADAEIAALPAIILTEDESDVVRESEDAPLAPVG